MRNAERDELLAALDAARGLETELLEDGSPEAIARIKQVRESLERLSYGTLTPTEFRRLRKQAGLTQEDLARILNRRLRQVGRYERGDTPVPREVGATLRELAGGG